MALADWIDTIITFDLDAWYYVNTMWRNDALDTLMPFFRNQYFWAPVYLLLLIALPLNFKIKGWLWCLFFLISFGLSDYISASILKPFFERVRPCNDPALAQYVINIVPCGGGKSFPSSHAANHFAISTFASCTLGRINKWLIIPFMFWATLVCYAQVYVGVHFPLDVLVGGILGAFIGYMTALFFNKYFPLTSKYEEQKSL